MLRWLLPAFIIVPLVEVFVLIQVGQVIGALPAVGLLLLVSVIGAGLVRREGARAWRRFTGAVGAGQVPAREAADGMLVLVGGTLLLTPGYVTDVLGLLLVLAPTRALVRPALTGWLAARVVRGSGFGGGGPFGVGQFGGGSGGAAPSGRGGGVIDGEVVEQEPADDQPGD